jgi:hypothetical protein
MVVAGATVDFVGHTEDESNHEGAMICARPQIMKIPRPTFETQPRSAVAPQDERWVLERSIFKGEHEVHEGGPARVGI